MVYISFGRTCRLDNYTLVIGVVIVLVIGNNLKSIGYKLVIVRVGYRLVVDANSL